MFYYIAKTIELAISLCKKEPLYCKLKVQMSGLFHLLTVQLYNKCHENGHNDIDRTNLSKRSISILSYNIDSTCDV